MPINGPSLSPYSATGVKTGRSGAAGDYFNTTIAAKAVNRQSCFGWATFTGVKTFNIVPVYCWADYPTGIVDIPLSGGNPTAGAPSAIYASYAATGSDQWVWTRPLLSDASVHGVELRYMCTLYSSGTRQIVWLSEGGGYTTFQQPCTPGPTQGLNLTKYPNIDFDLSISCEMNVDVNLTERVSITQNTGAGGAWVWPTDCFEDGMGKTTATFSASSTNIESEIVINGSTFASSAMPSGYITSYDFGSARTIEGKVGLYTSALGFFGWGYDHYAVTLNAYTMSGSAVFADLTDVAHCSMGVKEMDLQLSPAVSGYQGDDTNCRGKGAGNTFTYMAKNAPASMSGAGVYTYAKWTNLGLSYQHQVDFQMMDGSSQSEAVTAQPVFVDSASASSWSGTTSPVFTYDGTWELKMYNLSGSIMATRNTETHANGTGATWANSNPGPTAIAIRFDNPEDFNTMTNGTLDDHRCQFVYPRDASVASYSLASSACVDTLSATGLSGTGGWTGLNCQAITVSGNVFVYGVSGDASIYRSDFIIGGNTRNPKHWPAYRFATLSAECLSGSVSGSEIPFNLSLTVSRNDGPDTMSKTFLADKKNNPVSGSVPVGMSVSGWIARYDTCYPTAAGTVDSTNSYIEQALPLSTEWIGGERVLAEQSNLSWSWGLGCFDKISVSGFATGCVYTLVDLSGKYEEPLEVGVERTYHGITTYVQGECDMEREVGDMVFNDYPEDNWRQSVWRHIIGVVDGKYGFEVPCVKVAKSPTFEIYNYSNFSVLSAFTSGVSGAFYPTDDYGCYSFSINSNYNTGYWDNAATGYNSEVVLFCSDVCPIWFCQTYSSEGEQDNLHSQTIMAAPLYDVISIYPNWGDGTGTTTRTGYATLKSIKRVSGRANGELFTGGLCPEASSLASSAQTLSVSVSSTWIETVASDKLGYFRTDNHRSPTKFTYTANKPSSTMKSRVWQRIVMDGLFLNSLRYQPGTGQLLFKRGVAASGSLSACLAGPSP